MFAVRTDGGTSATPVPIFQSLRANAAAPMSGKKTRIVFSGSAAADDDDAGAKTSSASGTSIVIVRPSSLVNATENSFIIGNVFFNVVYVMSPTLVSKSTRTRICPDAKQSIDRATALSTASWNEFGSSVTSDDSGSSSPMMDAVYLDTSNGGGDDDAAADNAVTARHNGRLVARHAALLPTNSATTATTSFIVIGKVHRSPDLPPLLTFHFHMT